VLDPRVERLANILVNYSVEVQPGDLVRISGSTVAEPLVVAVFRQVVKAGGSAAIRLTPDQCQGVLLRSGTDEQLSYVSPLVMHETETIDCSINITGSENTKALTNVDPAWQRLAAEARKPVLNRFLQRAAGKALCWVGSEFPTNAGAQNADMSLNEYEDFVFAAGLLHLDDPAAAWREIGARQQRACDLLERVKELHFTAPNGTDLWIGVEGRHWVNCDGKTNFPDGEVFTAPIEDTTRGVICYSFPAVLQGREVDGIRLEFKDGRVADARAAKGQDFLIQMLDADPGTRILGEIGISTNYAITRYSKRALFDEKIGGTFHCALAASFPESGGKNQSGIHWDMVCDLRAGGSIKADGRIISENGRFSDTDWPQS
jgi:aminopeptidase